MPGTIRTYFRGYADTQRGFKMFHKQVINMPRHGFKNMGFQILRQLAAYLLLIEKTVSPSGNNYKEIMNLIHNEIAVGHNPLIRDIDFEETYFNFIDLDMHYNGPGRMFRHYMGLCAFWGMLFSGQKKKKVIDFGACQDFISIESDRMTDFVRNLGLNVDIKTNDFISNTRGVCSIKSDANYHPTLAILKYMNDISRAVSDFEISVLFGRIDNLQDETIILQRALDIGRQFISADRNGQMQEFFKAMGWVNNTGTLFSYASSQQPWFKFRSYILFLQDFGLIAQNSATKNYTLTDYAKELLGELPATIIDLNKLIAKLNLDSGNMSDIALKNILMKINSDSLTALFAQPDFIKKINRYSIDNPINTRGGKKRNQLIAELARIREKYTCQAGSVTFERSDGRNYVEAHHIIEFSKGGPDILENLLVLGPTPHNQIHRGSESARRDIYAHLMSNGAIRYTLFRDMVEEYRCLTREHLDFLDERKLISSQQKAELLQLVCKN